MKRSRTSLLVASVVALSSCGGSTASSTESVPSQAPPSSADSVPASVTTGSTNSEVTTLPPVTVAVDPTNLLIDSSLDIAAIDGPVVLWFWAPG